MGTLRRLSIEVIFTDDKSVAHGWAYYEGQAPAKVDLGEHVVSSIHPFDPSHGMTIQDAVDPFGWIALDHVQKDDE